MKASLPTLFKIAGLPEPVTEFRFSASRRWRFDYCWPSLWLALEREGGTWTGGRHTRPRGYRNDAEKYNAAQIAGWLVLRFTVDMIRDGTALSQLQEAVEAIKDKVKQRQ